MSRAFIKEDAQHDDVQVVPRAPLPEGAKNLVTRSGLDLLLAEREEILTALAATEAGEADGAVGHAGEGVAPERLRLALEAALDELLPRLATAELSEPHDDAEVRFGHAVTLTPADAKGGEVSVRIVGVDEADPEAGSISYLAPLAQALLGKLLGDEVVMGPSGRRMIIAAIG